MTFDDFQSNCEKTNWHEVDGLVDRLDPEANPVKVTRHVRHCWFLALKWMGWVMKKTQGKSLTKNIEFESLRSLELVVGRVGDFCKQVFLGGEARHRSSRKCVGFLVSHSMLHLLVVQPPEESFFFLAHGCFPKFLIFMRSFSKICRVP